MHERKTHRAESKFKSICGVEDRGLTKTYRTDNAK